MLELCKQVNRKEYQQDLPTRIETLNTKQKKKKKKKEPPKRTETQNTEN